MALKFIPNTVWVVFLKLWCRSYRGKTLWGIPGSTPILNTLNCAIFLQVLPKLYDQSRSKIDKLNKSDNIVRGGKKKKGWKHTSNEKRISGQRTKLSCQSKNTGVGQTNALDRWMFHGSVECRLSRSNQICSFSVEHDCSDMSLSYC